ncbi:hypothetical protein CCR80_06850 [Rhodothalassium salexigens]|uniref:hypothetical protein n=1 Tax=Rhodothalassium salexigens TaxID=1086 RepID=UPI001914C4CE|nr:hypothetical protein [Rhodothalassium salexigens]MBK5920752.1 hypothetical protein [Rhodothalassium salexigens]
MNDVAEIELFRPGSFTAMNGQKLDFTSETLSEVAASYNPATYDAPVVVGHPRADAPAYGWVKGLRMDGDRLKASLHKIDQAFAELVKDGKFRKVSASFYTPDHPNNPTPGKLSLRHVGFLGAQPPAVNGLKPVEFSDGGADLVEIEAPGAADFAEADAATVEELRDLVQSLTRQVQDLQAQKADTESAFAEEQRRQRHNDNRAFIEGLVKEGRFIPGHAEPMVAFLDAMDGPGEIIEFAEHGETVERNSGDFIRDYLRSQPVTIHFNEFAPADAEAMGDNSTEDEAAQQIAEWVESERAQGRSVSYSDALRYVTLSRKA